MGAILAVASDAFIHTHTHTLDPAWTEELELQHSTLANLDNLD